MKKKKRYFVMDERAHYDPDAALVFETFTATSDAKAIKYYLREYVDMDTALCDEKLNVIK